MSGLDQIRACPQHGPEQVLLAVFAHPDDETFRPGGMLALLAQRGVRVHLVTATRGGAGSCGDPPLCRQEELPTVREQELRCASAALGIEQIRILNYQDGHLAEVDPEQLTARVSAVVQEIRPQVVLTFGPEGLSGHPDHIAIGRSTAQAFRQVEEVAALYAVAVPRSLAKRLGMKRVRPVPDEGIDLVVDVSPVWESKLAAIHCHATQRGLCPMTRVPLEQQRFFFGTEYFVQLAVHRPEQDFLRGLFELVRNAP